MSMDAATGLLYDALLEAASATTGRVAVCNALADGRLAPLAGEYRLDLLQEFRPEAVALAESGMTAMDGLAGPYDLVAVRPSKNKLQTLGWVAQAIDQLADGGLLLLAAANNHGAKSYEKLLAEVGSVSSASKAKCRLLRLRKSDAIDHGRLAEWLENAAPRQQSSHGLWSAPGLFSWEHADAGSALLLAQLPEQLAGSGMDLCCGYGFLASSLLQRHAEIARLHLLDADRLAVSMAGRNTEAFAGKVELHWRDAACEALPQRLDWVVCNPPFHSGQARDVELGQAIVANGCRSLKRGGRIFIVANRKLPYEAVLESELSRVEVLMQAEGYKVIAGSR